MMKKIREKFSSLSAAKRSSIAFMFAGFVQQGMGFLVTPLFTRLLSTADFGLVTVYQSWVEILGTVAMLSLSSGIFNVGMMDHEGDRDGFTSALLGISNIATVITVSVFYAASLVFPDVVKLPKSLFVLMFLYFCFQPAMRFWTARQRFEYRYKTLTIVTVCSAVLSPVIGVICVLTNNSNLGVMRLWGTNSVLIVFGVAFYIHTLRKNSRLFNKKIWAYALKFSLPLLPHYLSMHLLAASDRVMIQAMIGASEAAVYGLAYTAGMTICTAWTAIQGSLTPYVYDKLKKNELEKIQPAAVPCIVIFSVMCMAVVVMAPEIIWLLGGAKYAESVPLIPPIIAAVLFMEMYNLFSMIEFYHKKTVRIMLATLAAAVINIVMNYFAIRRFGYGAAAYTTLICYALYTFFHYMNMRRIEPGKIYDSRFLVIFSALYTAFCLGCSLIYPYPGLRYGIAGVIGLAVFINRKKIMQRVRVKKFA